MKKHNLLGMVAAGAILVFASGASAHEVSQRSECQENRQHSGAVGGVVGAGLGAAAGHAIAASNVRPEGIAVGMLVGAIVGHKVGRESAECEAEVSTQPYGRSYGEHGRSYGEQRYHSNGRNHRAGHDRRAEPVVSHDDYQEHVQHQHHQHHQNHAGDMEHHNHAQAQSQQYSQSNSGWYEPSRYSYYGMQNAGAVSYQQSGYSSGGQVVQQWSYGPTYVPAPQAVPPMMVPNYAPQQYAPAQQYAPPQAAASPCGRWVCE